MSIDAYMFYRNCIDRALSAQQLSGIIQRMRAAKDISDDDFARLCVQVGERYRPVIERSERVA